MTRIYIERRDLPEEAQRLFDAIWDEESGGPSVAAEWSPPLDVLDGDDGVEVFVDLAGVPISAVQVVFAQNVLLVAGHKLPPACDHHEAAFHLAERTFGRFARAIRLDGAFEGSQAAATLIAGELRIAIPRIAERRGREIRIPVRA